MWETFKHHVERFYSFIHLDREFRELDYKHNYKEKLKIIERAESLQEYPNIIKATRDLNTLHLKWKNDLGPVAKEHSEDLWVRFKKATKNNSKEKNKNTKKHYWNYEGEFGKKEYSLKRNGFITQSRNKRSQ